MDVDGFEEYSVPLPNWKEDKLGQCKSPDSAEKDLVQETNDYIPP